MKTLIYFLALILGWVCVLQGIRIDLQTQEIIRQERITRMCVLPVVIQQAVPYPKRTKDLRPIVKEQ